MKVFTESPFFRKLKSGCTQGILLPEEEMEDCFDEFCKTIVDYYTGSEPIRNVLVCLNYTKCQLAGLQHDLTESSLQITKWLNQSLSFIEEMQKIISYEIEFPHIGKSTQPKKHSPLYLSERYSHMDILEMLTGLQGLEIFVKRDGQPASLNLLTKVISEAINLELKNPEQARAAILMRKNPVRFVDALRNQIQDMAIR